VILIVGGVLCAGVYFAPAFFIKDEKPDPSTHLKTGGTSNVFIIMENRWRQAYRKDKGIEVEYDNVGSTKGLAGLTDKKYALAFTHAPMSEEQQKKAKEKGGEVVHVPVVLCAVVPIYNVKELKGKPRLKFTGEVLGDIFLGKIDKWNDPAIKKLNEDAELPDTKITVIHRKDSSGTTFIFADYLAGASPAWKEKMGAAKNEIDWPVGEGKDRNDGVAMYVQQTEGAIGYVDLLHAYVKEIPYGAVQNKDKTAFIHAEAENMTAALKGSISEVHDDLTFSLTNKGGKDSYPICGGIWAVCYKNQPGDKQKQVVDFLTWATHDGQKFASGMTYAPLPEELIDRVEEKIKSIKAQ
jgi:phosphate transport system substrate-binding protein